MKKVRNYSILTIVIALILATSGFFVPIPQNVNTLEFQIPFFVVTFIAVVYTGSALIFINGLKSFQVGLRVSYKFICAGVVLLGLGQVQLPIFYYFNLWESAWNIYGVLQYPGLFGAVLFFIGVRKFGALLGYKSQANALLFVISFSIVLSLIGALLPHSSNSNIYGSELFFDYNLALVVITAVFLTFGVALIFKIKQKAGRSFTNALAWFFLAMFFHTMAVWQIVVLEFVGFENFYVLSGLFWFVWVIASICLLRSSYAFNKVNMT